MIRWGKHPCLPSYKLKTTGEVEELCEGFMKAILTIVYIDYGLHGLHWLRLVTTLTNE